MGYNEGIEKHIEEEQGIILHSSQSQRPDQGGRSIRGSNSEELRP